MTDEKRPYRKKRRAEHEAETRLRITESAMALHGSLGPARTSMSAVAERAGVQRSTLYRHFPDEASLFQACSSHWATLNPPPDLDAWAGIDDPRERLRAGLTELYGYYRRNEAMLANLERDESVVPIVAELFSAFRGYLDAARKALLAPRPAKTERAAVGHAIAFTTWRSLAREQVLEDRAAAGLMADLVAAARR